MALIIIGIALIGVILSACSSGPSCHVVTHKGHRECIGQKQISGPSGPLFIPVYWPIGYAAPGYVYRPPPVQAPVEDPVEIPVEEPVVVGGE